MKFRRIAGAASVVAMLFLATIGAGAAIAAPPSVVINSPGVDVSYEAYPAISGSITQEGAQPELTSASVALSSNDGWSSENSTQSWPGGSIFSGGGASITYNWTPKPKYNGRYTVTVTGSGRSGGFGGQTVQTNIVTRSFNIAIDPVKPTGVAAGMDDAGRVTISWQANPEPDIAGYQLYRSYQNGNPGKVGDPIPASSKPTATDNLSGKPTGAYKYAVEAIRRARTCASSSTDPVCKEGLTGPLSSYSAAVTVRGAGATTTTSTTIKKNPGTGGGGNNNGGGNTGGSSGGTTGTTRPGSGSGSAGGGKAAPRNTGGFAPDGNVDLSQFGGLLGGNGRMPGVGGQEDEGTYDGELPYDPSEQPIESGDGDDSLISIGGASVPAPNEDWVKFIGAGSFVTALLVHVLWFKQQVDAIPLEAID